MPLQLLFWILMLFWIFFGVVPNWPKPDQSKYPFAGSLLLFVLIAMLGWQIFGPAIHR